MKPEHFREQVSCFRCEHYTRVGALSGIELYCTKHKFKMEWSEATTGICNDFERDE
jgi:hypothetical protein